MRDVIGGVGSGHSTPRAVWKRGVNDYDDDEETGFAATSPGQSSPHTANKEIVPPAFCSKYSPGNLSTAEITHGAHQLYHRLQEEEKEMRHELRKRTVSLGSSMASSDDGGVSFESSEESDNLKNKHIAIRILIHLVRFPSLVVQFLCMITIPMTDKHWNDKFSIICCMTAPVFALVCVLLLCFCVKLV